MRISAGSQGLANQRTLCGVVFWHLTVSVTPPEMSAQAPSVAVRRAADSVEAEAILQAVWPLKVMHTRALYFELERRNVE
jgi:hypothetical protein